MAQYKTPDVYVKERSLLSPSVAEVPTAIPAFIGYTQFIEDNKGDSILQKPHRITNMLNFMAIFGNEYNETINVDFKPVTSEFVIPGPGGAGTTNPALSTYFLYQAVAHFFGNGGGTCYVTSIGDYATNSKAKSDFTSAIMALKKVDEVTLIACPESICLTAQDHYDVQNASLQHCEMMQDRFALVDVMQSSDIRGDASLMRDKVTQGLKYGAAYYPYLRTSIARAYDEYTVKVNTPLHYYALHEVSPKFYALEVNGSDPDNIIIDKIEVDKYGYGVTNSSDFYSVFYLEISSDIIVDFAGYQVVHTDVDTLGQRISGQAQIGLYKAAGAGNESITLNLQGQEIQANGDLGDKYSLVEVYEEKEIPLSALNNPGYRFASTAYYNQIKSLLSKNYLQLPPSAAIAGAMAKTDGQHGVWKAPANVALSQVIEPSINIDNGEQEDLNVDIIAGKSINAIRSFVGKGTLVWGARTLDGNSNEWRYVPVRRLFNMVEESIKKASYFAVFEPNTPFTWLKVKTTIDGYLENLWKQGALFGASPDQAFFVNVGLGQTMTEDDINNGIMNIEIGLAAVRPAEFIVLTFSHKSIGA